MKTMLLIVFILIVVTAILPIVVKNIEKRKKK